VSTDRGLCGGLNINLFKAVLREMKAWNGKGVEIDLCVIGAKASSFFGSMGGRITAALRGLGDEPAAADLIGGVKVVLDAYAAGKVDQVFIAYNTFVNTMTQQPTVAQVLPLEASEEKELKHHWDYLYEPDAKELLDGLLTRYIESQVYQGVVENGRLRAGRADGGHESGHGQRRSADQRPETRLQQGAPGCDHAGARRDRQRRRGGLATRIGASPPDSAMDWNGLRSAPRARSKN
jgi:hypothetical protein